VLKRLRQFSDLPPAEKLAVLWALFLVVGVRMALWTLPFRVIAAYSARGVPTSRSLASVRLGRLSWAVQAVAKRVPHATCLTQALALQMLMGKAGREAELTIGVTRGRDRAFEAHAWLKHNGAILVGDHSDLASFSPILNRALPLPTSDSIQERA